MAEAQFIPAAPPGYAVDAAIGGYNSGQTFMQRAQTMRFAQQDQDRQNAQWAVMQPVLQAKGQADIANAQATLQNAAAVQRLRTQFGQDSVQAQKDYEDAMQEASYDNQAEALSRVAQKYAYFSLLPEGKPFLEAVQNQQLQAHQNYMLDSHIDAERDLTDQRAQNAIDLEKQKSADLLAAYNASGKGKTQDERLAEEMQNAYSAGDTQRGDLLKAVLQRRGTVPSGSLSQAEQIIQLNNKAAELRSMGENGLADQLEARANYYKNPNAAKIDASNQILSGFLGIPVTPTTGTATPSTSPVLPLSAPPAGSASPASSSPPPIDYSKLKF